MKRIAIITARGGSKRIPRKNIKPFLGKPIINYSIEAALQSGMFDTVMVSTDDEEIARIAGQAGAAVPFMRSAQTANDFATTADVVCEVLEEYRKRGQIFSQACIIYPTAPFLTKEAIREAMEILTREKADSVLPVVKFSFPPQRCVIMENHRLKAKWPECMPMRSQDLEPYYHDCGQFYCIRVESFMRQKKIIMEDTAAFIQDERNVQDIDTLQDWEIAEMKFRILHPETAGSDHRI